MKDSIMEKLFAALEAKHPGCKVLDVQFTINYSDNLQDAPRYSVKEYDELLASAIESAVALDISML